MLAYYVHNLDPDLVHIYGNANIHWYGLCYVIGFYLAWLVMTRLAKRGIGELKPEPIADFITGTAIFGVVIGGRLGYELFYNLDGFLHDPLVFFKMWDGGMASHGGIAGVALYLLYYARKHKLSWTGLGDNLVSGAPLGILSVRIANFINGELFGRITDVPWAVKFPTEIHHLDFLTRTKSQLPFESFPQHSPDILAYYQQHYGDTSQFIDLLYPRHPSQLYEAAGEGLLLFLVLYTLRVRFPKMPNGILTGLFFLGYASIRIALENVRQPDSGAQMVLGVLTPGQFYSTFMILAGAAFLFYGWTQRNKPVTAAAEPSPPPP